jgi:hypothetical protein
LLQNEASYLASPLPGIQNIVNLQRKKARLAEFTMAAASDRTATFDLEVTMNLTLLAKDA